MEHSTSEEEKRPQAQAPGAVNAAEVGFLQESFSPSLAFGQTRRTSLSTLVDTKEEEVVRMPSLALLQMRSIAPVVGHDQLKGLRKDVRDDIVVAKGVTKMELKALEAKGTPEEEKQRIREKIVSAIFDDIVDKTNATELAYKLLLYLLVELYKQTPELHITEDGQEHSKHKHTTPLWGCRKKVEQWIKDENMSLQLTEGWAVIVLEQISATKFIFQTAKAGKNDKEAIFRYKEVTGVKNGEAVVIKPKGVLYRLQEVSSYRRTSDGTIYPFEYLRVSKPILTQDGKTCYVVELSPDFAGLTHAHFTKMRAEDLAYLFKGRKPALTFKLYSHLIERNRTDLQTYPFYKPQLSYLLQHISSDKERKKNPKRVREYLANAIRDMVSIGLIVKIPELPAKDGRVYFEFNPDHNKRATRPAHQYLSV